ncbi:MAG TPA: Hsp20/alpha crystallin family protein [Gammaproteobacteria bacterium]|nr:Hsp20/alpha crystallin family protein [Gammaproteobacteria bacterium]
MNVIRYEPWTAMDQLMNHLFDGRRLALAGETAAASAPGIAWTPTVDIKEEAGRYVIHADVPGVDPKDIEVTLDEGVLTLSGERKSESRTEEDGWKRVERVSGQFLRRFTLPETVDAEGVSARGANGVLEIVIPKQAKVQPKKIEVKVN